MDKYNESGAISAASRRTRDIFSKAKLSLGCSREAGDDLNGSAPGRRCDIGNHLLLLLNQILANSFIERSAARRHSQADRTRILQICETLHIAFAQQRPDDPARGALVEEESVRKGVQSHRTRFNHRFECIALRHRDVVAADAITIAKLIGAHEVC